MCLVSLLDECPALKTPLLKNASRGCVHKHGRLQGCALGIKLDAGLAQREPGLPDVHRGVGGPGLEGPTEPRAVESAGGCARCRLSGVLPGAVQSLVRSRPSAGLME